MTSKIINSYTIAVLHILSQGPALKGTLYNSDWQKVVLDELFEKGFITQDKKRYKMRLTKEGGKLYQEFVWFAEKLGDESYIEYAGKLEQKNQLHRVLKSRNQV